MPYLNKRQMGVYLNIDININNIFINDVMFIQYTY